MNAKRLKYLRELCDRSNPKPISKTGAKPFLIGGDFTPTMHKPCCPCDECVETTNSMNGIVFNGNEFRDATIELLDHIEKLQTVVDVTRAFMQRQNHTCRRTEDCWICDIDRALKEFDK